MSAIFAKKKGSSSGAKLPPIWRTSPRPSVEAQIGGQAAHQRWGAADRSEYREAARTTAKAVIGSVDLVIRLTQRSFLYLVAVYVLDPNLRSLAAPLIRFENGVAEIMESTSAMYFSPLILIFQAIWDHLWSACLHLSLAIPYRAFELSQHAIEYETRISGGIFVGHFSVHAQERIAIFFEWKRAFFVERIS
jgi:hypothetical protein